MINALIDASVIAVPVPQKEAEAEEIFINYLMQLGVICELLGYGGVGIGINTYISIDDLDMLDTFNLLPYDSHEIKINSEDYDPEPYINVISDLISRLLQNNRGKRDISTYRIFENKYPFSIDNIDQADVFLPNEFLNQFNKNWDNMDSAMIAKHSFTNATKIALLSNSVFHNNNKIISLILNSSISELPINMENINVHFHGDPWRKHNYCIPNMQATNNIVQQIVQVSDLYKLLENYHLLKEYHIFMGNDNSHIQAAYKKAQEEFGDFLVFGADVPLGITEYERKIIKYPHENDEEIAAKLYFCLKVLYEYARNMKHGNSSVCATANLDYCCNIQCSAKQYCKSIISLLGADCIEDINVLKGSTQEQEKFIRKDRTWDNRYGDKELFTLHLKPYSPMCNNSRHWYRSLRIYFKLDFSQGQMKIAIGWIGRHPYLPCNGKYYKANNPICQNCPLNTSKKMSEEDRYNRYIDQWAHEYSPMEEEKIC